jgi:hypothetical protein
LTDDENQKRKAVLALEPSASEGAGLVHAVSTRTENVVINQALSVN